MVSFVLRSVLTGPCSFLILLNQWREELQQQLADEYELPEKYAWLNPDGVSAGSLRMNKEGYEMIAQDWHIPNNLVEGVYKYPLNVCLSEYHVILLHSDRLQAISLLNQKVAFEDIFQVCPYMRICLDAP